MASETSSTEETPEGWKMHPMPAAIMRTKADIITYISLIGVSQLQEPARHSG
jgi:hypothetical protein